MLKLDKISKQKLTELLEKSARTLLGNKEDNILVDVTPTLQTLSIENIMILTVGATVLPIEFKVGIAMGLLLAEESLISRELSELESIVKGN